MKYREYQTIQPKQKRVIHPIWRGIGFLLMIIVPVLSYFAAIEILDANSANNWVPIPAEFLMKGADPLLAVKIGLAVVLAILVFILFNFVAFLSNSLFGAPRYGPQDSPDLQVRKSHRR
jgi:hypothetical protein